MNTELNTSRFLGAAFLFVFAASMISERLLTSVAGSGEISDVMERISQRVTLIRISNLVALANSAGIVVLAVLLYTVFKDQNKILAPLVLGLRLTEAITLAVSKTGALALVPLSREFVGAGAPDASPFQTLGRFLYHGLDRMGYDLHMLFFCLGGIVWCYLFYSSGYIPRALSVWGMAAIGLLLIPVLIVLYDRNLTGAMIAAIPYVPFEVVLGVWLMVKGLK